MTVLISASTGVMPPTAATAFTSPLQPSPTHSSSSSSSSTTTSLLSSPSAGASFETSNVPSSTERNDNNNGSRRHLWLVVDFDGTCTIKDTTRVVTKLARRYSREILDVEEQQKRRQSYDHLEQEYFDRYRAVQTQIFHDNGESSHKNPQSETESEELTKQRNRSTSLSLEEELDLFDEVSTYVTNKISQAQCLQGVPTSVEESEKVIQFMKECHETSNECKLHDHCVSTIGTAYRMGWKLGILSINWCPPLIDAALLQPISQFVIDVGQSTTTTTNRQQDQQPPRQLQAELWCNSINEDGHVTLKVPGAIAKRERLAKLKQQILKEKQQQQSSSSSSSSHTGSSMIVYIGDSSTDILGLLEADVGILLGDNPFSSAHKMLQRWNIPVKSLTQYDNDSKDQVGDDNNIVWSASSWKEIDSFLKRIASDPQ